jgi:hypothetical protein
MPVTELASTLLQELARKYVWWKSPGEAMAFPERIVAQVMDIGDYVDVQRVNDELGEDLLRRVLVEAEMGQFTPRSWAYWHYRLGLAEPERVPPMPGRKIV